MVDQRVSFELDTETHIARITLRNAERGNAVDSAMGAAICGYLDEVERDDDIKVVVLSGDGRDLSIGWEPEEVWQQYLDAPGGSVRKHPSQRARLTAQADNWWGPQGLYTRLLKCRKITILEARGACLETGLYFALCCDLIVASDDARFGNPRWQNVGMDGDISLLVATVGLKRAKDLMFCGLDWTAAEAVGFGLIDWNGPGDEVRGKSDEFAEMCASIMRDGIVSEKYAVFASLAKMGVDLSFAATTVVSASLSNIHFQSGEYNFVRELGREGRDAALTSSRSTR